MATNTSTSFTGMPNWLAPAAGQYLGMANSVAQSPYTKSPTQVAAPNQYQTQGWQSIANRATQGSPVMSAANQQMQKTISGGYLNSNPYLDGMVDKAQGDVVRNYNMVAKPQMEAAMVRSGSFGNSGLMEMQQEQQRQLQGTLGDISTQIRGNNYANERGMQQQAMGMAPQFAQTDYQDASMLLGAGNQMQDYTKQQQGQNYQWWKEAMDYPRQQLDTYGGVIGNLMGNNRQTTQTTPGTSTGASALGGALTAAQIYALLKGD